MYRFISHIILIIFSFIMLSSSCSPKSAECGDVDRVTCCDGTLSCDELLCPNCLGCTDINACNFDSSANIEDNSCWYSSEECTCDNPKNSVPDCLGVCDEDSNNNPPDSNNDGICDEGVIGGCLDLENCNYNAIATHNNGTCMKDLSLYGSPYIDGKDCNAVCGGSSVMDGCEISKCINNEFGLYDSWRIKVQIESIFKLIEDYTVISIDTNAIILGASIYAENEYNDIQIGCGENCYPDIPAPPAGLELNSTRFYFPHPEWEYSGQISNENYFVQDIRYNNLHTSFSEGVEWNAILEPINLSSGITLDVLRVTFDYIEGLSNCQIKININNESKIIVSNGEILEFAVNSTDEIYLTFIISDFCFSEL